MAYLGKTPSQAVRSRYYFTASGGETSLAPAQVTGLSFTDANYVDVSLNGVALVSGTDYTATPSTNTISSLSALTASDVVEIVVYDTFSVFGGSVNGDFNISGGDLTLGDNDKAIFGAGSDMSLFHNGNNAFLDNDTGSLFIQTDAFSVKNATGTESVMLGTADGAVTLYHNNQSKLATTSAGIDVTGTVTADGLTVDGNASITANLPTFTITGQGRANGFEIAGTSGNTTLTEKSNNGIEFGTNNTTRMTITSGGNVGIGTNSPSQKLSIVESGGSARMELLSGTSGTSIIDMGDTSDADIGGIRYENTNNAMLFRTNNNERLRITNGGNVGIGTSSPSVRLDTRLGTTTGKVAEFHNSAGYGIGFTVESDGGVNTINSESNQALAFATNGASNERMRILSGGNVGISTTSPEGLIGLPATASNTPKFRLQSASTNTDFAISSYADANGTYVSLGANHYLDSGGNDAVFETTDKSAYVLLDARNNGMVAFGTNSSGVATERMRIDSSGNVGIGTSSPSTILTLKRDSAGTSQSDYPLLSLDNGNANGFSQLRFADDGVEIASILSNSADQYLVFRAGGATERVRIDSSGNLMVGRTSTALSGTGVLLVRNSANFMGADTTNVLALNRNNNDGDLMQFRQADNIEGSISVSGTTVSYNGGHLSRWSQATDGNRITGLVKGTVMTNLDQMAVWSHDEVIWTADDELPDGVSVGDVKTAAFTEDNEQLNCMAVSSVEGDANVAGVFVNWDNDDDDFNDMNIAMTGDMVIRIASGTTVARGDLLMSAGDGTAKPQGDDIVRSKTIAKVTSTNVSHTYDDGSYLVPCVLMAC